MDNNIKIEKDIKIPLHRSINFTILDEMDIDDSFIAGQYDRNLQRQWTAIVFRYRKLKGNTKKKFVVRGVRHKDNSVELRIWRVR